MEEKRYTCVFSSDCGEIFRQQLSPKDFPRKGKLLIFHYFNEEIQKEDEFRWFISDVGILQKGIIDESMPEIHFLIDPYRG